MSSGNRGSTALSAKEKKEKEKRDKKDRDKSEKFDPNIEKEDGSSNGDVDLTPSSSKATAHKGEEDLSEMQQFCKVLQSGFDSVTKKLGEKLDAVGEKFGNSLNDLHTSLDDRLTELATDNGVSEPLPDSDDDMLDSGQFCSGIQRSADHEMSDTSSNATTSKEVTDSYFKQRNKPKPKEKVGALVNEDLADIVNRDFSSPMSANDFKTFKEKFVRPENVQWLATPEIPFNIYRRLNSDFKDVDKRLKYIQEQLCPVAVGLTYALDKLGTGDIKEGMDTLSETLEGFGYVFRTEITEKRRSLLKPKLPDDFKVLASDKCPPTPSNLLGNISENSKKISETEKIAAQMDRTFKARAQSSKKNNNRDKPYSKNNNNNNNNNNKGFYSKKGGFFNKKNDYQRKGSDWKDNSKNYSHGDNNDSYFQRRNQRRK